MLKKTFTIISCFILFITIKVNAQNPQPINGDFRQLSFVQFADSIESKYAYHFYFDTAETNLFQINITANNLTIKQLLAKALERTTLNYAVDSLNRVFITNTITIQTSFPPDFFVSKKVTDSSLTKEIATTGVPVNKFGDSTENKLIYIGSENSNIQKNATIAGYIRDKKSGESIINASVYVDSPRIGVTTDNYGYFSITLPKGYHTINISSTGMKDAKRKVMLNSDGKLYVELEDYVASLKEVVVTTALKNSNISGLQMGANILSIKTIKQIPVVFGEADITKAVLTLPGVTSVGEASNGFNVRGGSVDQNLILFSDATVYNSSHLFGFFSAFNPDVVKGIELYKSTIPEKYGGRLSSVLAVDIKDGNAKKWTGAAGIGPLTSKFYIEGPIKKDKTSIIASIRTTYSDWLLNQVPNNTYENSSANFNDVTIHINHTINSKNALYITGYVSNDKFRLRSDTLYKYANSNANIKWKHNFNNRFSNVITAGADRYKYDVSSSNNEVNGFKLSFDINQFNFRSDFSFQPNNHHLISFGLNSIYYKLHPGSIMPEGEKSLIVADEIEAEQALESAVYIGDQYTVTPKFAVNAGLRFSVFNYLGAHTVNTYINGLPKDTATIITVTDYAKNKIIKTYTAPEVRLSARYTLSNNSSVKLSFNTTRQFINLISNSTTISPTDIWKLSDLNIKPQSGYQVSAGYYHDFKSNSIETSVEAYYKRIENYLDYRSGAQLLLNHHIETDVISTNGKAYGAELLIKKNAGKINGWLSYTYSRSLLKADKITEDEIVNQGRYYPASFDKPHAVNFIPNYQFSHRYNISLNVVYSTGRPITLPLAVFNSGGAAGIYYSDRNAYRVPDYFRTDLSINIDGNFKVKQKTHNSFSVGVYNLTGRNNVYSIYFNQQNGIVKGYQLSIFGSPIPFITYTIRF